MYKTCVHTWSYLLEPSDMSSSTTAEEIKELVIITHTKYTKKALKYLSFDYKCTVFMWNIYSKHICFYKLVHTLGHISHVHRYTSFLTSIQHDGGGFFPFSPDWCFYQWCLNCEQTNIWTTKCLQVHTCTPGYTHTTSIYNHDPVLEIIAAMHAYL